MDGGSGYLIAFFFVVMPLIVLGPSIVKNLIDAVSDLF